MKRIDFTCKKITIKDIIQCNYNINDREYEVFKEIMKKRKGGVSVKELSNKLEKQRTTIQKILFKLLNKNLIKKKQINLDRGYMYVYFPVEKEKIIEEVENNIENYYNSLKKSISKWKGN